MKKYFLSLVFLIAFVFSKAQTVSFFVNGHTDDVPLFMSSKLIADIKAGNKVVLVTLTASDEGWGNTSFNGSSVPFYLSCEKGLVYATKFCYDISVNSNIVLTPLLQTVSINGHNITKYVYKNSINYFLRLPDGGAAGAGYSQTGNASLQKLNTGAIAAISAVDGSAAYSGWNDILNTINSIINVENGVNAAYINTPSVNSAYNPSESSDHFYAGLAAQNAVSTFAWAGINEFVGSSSLNLAGNLTNSDFLNCSGVFSVYNYALIENNYVTKYTNFNKAYMPMDYYNGLKIPNSCNSVTGLNTTNITGNTVTINWAGVAGTVGYDVDYKPNNSNVWINAVTATTTTSVSITGLSAGTLYDYRVRRKCSASYSANSSASFTTSTTAVCNVPAGLNNSNIDAGSATVAWTVVSGAISYQLEYKLNAASTFTVYNTALTATSATITGLSASSLYQWRVKTNCNGGLSSAYSSLTFTTTAPLTCATPVNLITSGITTTSAVFSWDAVSGVNNYTVDYKLTSSGTWLTLSSALAATTITASGLQSNTNYDWRVKANCSNGVISTYGSAAFITSAPLTCATPVNLITSGITTTSAVFSWDAVGGVNNYTVEYKLTSSGTWLTLSSALAATTITASGLQSSTNYDWRVKANCSNGVISAYNTANFITSNATTTCNKPVNLYVTNVSSSRCTLNWDAVAGVTGYTIQLRQYGSANWSTPASSINTTSYTLTGLNYYTIYEWRIAANCSNGSTNLSDVFIFLTSCIDFNEPNNTTAQAKLFDIGDVANAQITTAGDVDFYKFTTVAPQTNFTVEVIDMPADYNLNLYNAAGQLLASSANTGTTAEKIVRNTTIADTYYFSVSGANGSFDSTQCYVYTVNSSSTALSAAALSGQNVTGVITGSSAETKVLTANKIATVAAGKSLLYPQPAADMVTIQYKADKNGTMLVKITDINGYTVQQNRVAINAGSNIVNMNILKLSSGVYILNLIDGQKITTQKLVIAR